MKILLFTDMHLRSASDRPKWRVDDHYKTQFAELNEIREIAAAQNVELIVTLGDFFDHTRVSYQLVTDVINWCRTLHCSIFSIVGNHDVNAYVTSDRNNGLGVLFESGAIGQLNELIWEDQKIIIRGIHANLDPRKGNYMFDEKYKDYFKLIASHNFIIPHEVPFDAVLPSQVETNANVIALGHYHKSFSHVEGKTNFINPGSISRWAINEQHQPQVLILDTNLGVITPIQLKSSLPAADIFDLAGAAEMKSSEMNIHTFIESLKETSFDAVDIESIILAAVAKQGVLSVVRDMALDKIRKAKEELV